MTAESRTARCHPWQALCLMVGDVTGLNAAVYSNKKTPRSSFAAREFAAPVPTAGPPSTRTLAALLAVSLLAWGCSNVTPVTNEGDPPSALTVSTTSLPYAVVGEAYSATLVASGGTAPYSWTLSSGSLPAGLSYNAATGVIAGTPVTSSAGAAMMFTATDAGNPTQSASVNLSLIVSAPGPAPLSITTVSLPPGQVGQRYTATLVASGGTAPLSWALIAGALPSGLTLNAASGAITGTPSATSAGTTLTLRVTDSGAPVQSSTATVVLVVAAAPPPALSITTVSLPRGQVGSPYGASLTASGGTPPYLWSVAAGMLPAGLTLNPANGAITGTPTISAPATALTLRVTDSGNPAQSTASSLTLVITAAPLLVTVTSLPGGQVGRPYSALLSATGGTVPYIWSVASGALPAGLTLNAASGAITGTPTASTSGTTVTFKVTDSGNPAQRSAAGLSLTISAAPLLVTAASLPGGQVGKPYSATLTATGGTLPYTWSLAAGTLPAGLALNAASGAITGAPTASAAASALTFKVTDSGNPAQSATTSLTLTIAPASLAITTPSLPGGQLGTAYKATLTATGGTPPLTWTLVSGTLPAGLTLNATSGAITGTPTGGTSVSALTLKVTDSGTPAQSATRGFTLTIAPASLIITTTALPTGQLGSAYTATLSATGGTVPYIWSVASGALPAGLTLNAASGAITGTPTAVTTGAATTFKVTDSGNPAQNATASLALTVASSLLTITTTSLPPAQVGKPYSATLTATGGTPPYTWTLGGTLPGGLSFSAAGILSGTPTTAVADDLLQFTVTDSGLPAQSRSIRAR
jgi:hypothetical protein